MGSALRERTRAMASCRRLTSERGVLRYACPVRTTNWLIAGFSLLVLACGGSKGKEAKEPVPEEKPQEIEVVPLEDDAASVLPPQTIPTLDPTGLATCKQKKHGKHAEES